MPSLGVNGATPYAQGTNHPTALNHSHRDVSSYDARRQTKMKCTYCGCWATKGSLCYQCKQPTGPLVLPRRNGYRVEPLIGVRTPASFRRSRSAYTTSTRSASAGGGGGVGEPYLSPRQRQRVGSLLLRDEGSGATAADSDGDARSQWNKSSTPTHDPSYSNPSSSSVLVVNRTSSARPTTSVYDRIGQPFAYTNNSSGSGASTPRRSASAAAYGHVSPRLAAGGPHGSPASTSSPSSSLYVGGQPAKRFYVPAPGVRASEQLVTHLREHVVAAREEASRDAKRRIKRKQSNENRDAASDGGGGGCDDDEEDDDIYGYYKAQREKARAMMAAGHGARTPSSVARTPSREARQADASTNSVIRDSHKGVTGGYFYHNDQTALGHKFREETPYDPSLQTKIKCRYCGCWARKNAPCALCKTVNK